jgi:hypothetical protein
MAPLPNGYQPPMRVPPKAAKAKNLRLTSDYLAARAQRSVALGYSKPKWVEFCEIALRRGFAVYLYEALHTASKYVTLRRDGRVFKVRFSNHKPIPSREAGRDCDFFVGVTNQTVTTTGQALRAAMAHFGEVA